MPIYEFYCPDCHTVLSFLARSVKPTAQPSCPHCGRTKLGREVSAFATPRRGAGGSADEGGDDLPPVNEARMERAMNELAGEAERVGDEDPRQAARLMRKFSDMTGMQLGGGMEEALKRLEAGEDPEAVESEMGDRMENEEPFVLPGGAKGARRRGAAPRPLRRDPKLYDL